MDPVSQEELAPVQTHLGAGALLFHLFFFSVSPFHAVFEHAQPSI